MKSKLTKEEREIIQLAVKENAKENIRNFFDRKLPWKVRIENGFYGYGFYLYIWSAWAIRNYKWVKEFLKIKLGISIKWVIITLLSAWVIAGSLRNASHY